MSLQTLERDQMRCGGFLSGESEPLLGPHCFPSPLSLGWLCSSCFCVLFQAPSRSPCSDQWQSWGRGALRDKAWLVKKLGKSGLIAKRHSEAPFGKLGAQMEPREGLAVSRTPCPHSGARRRGRQEMDLFLGATMLGRWNTY